MHVSAKVDYAVRAALELAAAWDEPVKAEEIARTQDISASFLRNILNDLGRSGLVRSQRGAEGGHRLARPPQEITVAEVMRAELGNLVDIHGDRPEDMSYPGAAGGLRDVWVAARVATRSVLEEVTLADVAAGSLPSAVTDLLEQPGAWRSHPRRSSPR